MTPAPEGTPPELLLATAKADRSLMDINFNLAVLALGRGDRAQAMDDLERALRWRTSAEEREARALSTPLAGA